MTTDDLISMHKATERVLEDMTTIDRFPHGEAALIDSQLALLRGSIQMLATVQRDLIAAVLGR